MPAFAQSYKKRTIVILLITVLASLVLVRFLQLDADPPEMFANFGNAVITDPYFYTNYARNAIAFGEWDLFNEEEFSIFRYSLVSASAWVVFLIAGVSRTTANLTGLLLNLGGLLMFLMAIHDRKRPMLTVITSLFLLGNVLFFFYSRYPLLENGLIFLTGATCLVYLKSRHHTVGQLATGGLIALAALAGKLIGVLLLGPVVVMLIVEHRRDVVKPLLLLFSGTLTVTIAYLYIVGNGSLQPFLDYLQNVESSTNRFVGLTSIRNYFGTFLTYPIQTRLPEFFGLLFPASVFGWFFYRFRQGKENSEMSGHIICFCAAWVLIVLAALSPADYRPARYATLIYFPLSYLSAYFCYRLANSDGVFVFARPLTTVLCILPGLLILCPAFVGAILPVQSTLRPLAENAIWVVLIALLISAAIAIGLKGRQIRLPVTMMRAALIGIILIGIVQEGFLIYKAVARPRYELLRLSKEFAQISGDGAVITGNYGPVMTTENDVKSLCRFFPQRLSEPELFNRFPVTHVAVGPKLWERCRDYYRLQNRSILLSAKSIRNAKIYLYRTNQPGYKKTLFDEAHDRYRLNDLPAAALLLSQFISDFPENGTARLFRIEVLFAMNRYDEVIQQTDSVAVMHPQSYNIQVFSAVLNANVWRTTGSTQARANAERYYRRAGELFAGLSMTLDEFLTGQ